MTILDADRSRPLDGGPSFSLRNRMVRAVWGIAWTLLAAWTPPPLHAWRRLVLHLFGARMAPGARVYGSTHVWYPANLVMGPKALIGPRVRCYNQDRITLGAGAIVSQGVHLCAGTHDIADANFQLLTRPILIGDGAWVAADAFIGPGVTIGAGTVVGARAVVMRDVPAWQVCAGNPARILRPRVLRDRT